MKPLTNCDPLLAKSWQVEYNAGFMERCRKRVVAVALIWNKHLALSFPRFEGNLVTAIFRHTLIPRYVQADFAAWLRKNWRDILAVLSPTLLAAQVGKTGALIITHSDSERFITGKGRPRLRPRSFVILAAIHLHVRANQLDAYSIVGTTPIEQELWRKFADLDSREHRLPA